MEVTEIDVVVEEAKPPITLDRAKRYYLESAQATQINDEECRLDAAYFHNRQLSDKWKAKLRERGQPEVWTNKIWPSIMGVIGYVDAARTDPQCQPRAPQQQDAADVGTKVLRYLNDCADMKRVRESLTKDFFIYGTCAALIGEAAYPGCSHIAVSPIHWENFFYDPISKEHDFSDARYLGINKMMDTNEIEQLYPETWKALGNPFDTGLNFFDSKKDDERLWLDRERRRLNVVELYFRDQQNKWQRVCFCSAGFLDFGASAFADDHGNDICPIVGASFEVDRDSPDGSVIRYGPIRAMRPLQDEFNARRSVLLNEAQNRRIRQTVEGIDPKSREIAKREAPKANGVLPYGWDMVSVPDIAAGQAQLLQQTQADIERLAPSQVVLSNMQGVDSAKARQVLQNAGLAEWARAFAHIENLEKTMNRHLWFAAKQFMTGPQWIRVTNEEHAAEWLQINVPVGINYVPAIDPQTGQPQVDPQTGQPVMQPQPVMEKAIAEMDVDIILDTVPDTTALQQEVNDAILKYSEGLGIAIDDPRFRMVMELFLTVDRTRQLERWDAAFEKMQGQNQPLQQMQMQMQQMQQQLEALHVQTRAAKDQANAHKSEAQAQEIEQRVHDNWVREQYARTVAPLIQQPPNTF